jgi:hypothetical protein
MQQRFNTTVCVSCSRVAIVAVALVIFPSFTLLAGTTSVATPVEVRSPAGVHLAEVATRVTTVENSGAAGNAFVMADWDAVNLGGVDRKVFEMALGAARCAVRSGAAADPGTLTVIDYSKASTARRLWVYDLRQRTLLFQELVAHGQGSGANFATEFSNEADTHRTSVGLFVTDDTYVGRNGYSLRLDGLDKGFNDRARERAIVMHGAPYVNDAFAKAQGRIGRSWGCPALDDAVARRVIDTVKGGGLVFSYYPDENWLNSSRYLGDCAD